jgi:hypothetical protein
MGEMGALYEDVAQLLMMARDTKSLNCELAVDAVPKEVPVQKLAENAHVDKMMQNEKELMKSLTLGQTETPSNLERRTTSDANVWNR